MSQRKVSNPLVWLRFYSSCCRRGTGEEAHEAPEAKSIGVALVGLGVETAALCDAAICFASSCKGIPSFPRDEHGLPVILLGSSGIQLRRARG